jgi:heparan-alpha-glucosaminide N-acetyltransferase
VWKAAVRSCKLFLLGLLVVNGPSYLPELRVPSVLSYFATATLVLGVVDALVPAGALPEAAPASLGAALYVDFGRFAAQWAAMLALGAVYLLVSFFLPVPGCPTGYLGAGGLADQGAYPACTGGAHGYVDRLLWGQEHIYGGATCRDVYKCVEVKYDPENTLGAISAAWMAWLGLHVGRMLVAQQAYAAGRPARRLAAAVTPRWLATGLALCLIAGLLCGFSKEHGVIPVNKNMWSPSFVALLAGFGCVNLTVFFNVVDVLKWWSGTPFRYAGANPLAVYLASEVFSDAFPLQWNYSVNGDWSSHSEKLLCNVLNVLFLLALARYWHLIRWSWNV